MKLILIFVVLCAVVALSSCTVDQTQSSAQLPVPDEIHQLDFWLGDFDVKMHKRGGVSRSHNVAIFNHRIIEENFYYPNGHIGLSWSVYLAKSDRWKQLWVDSGGNFLPFVGGVEGEGVILAGAVPEGAQHRTKMVFSDITPDGHEWRYSASNDRGATWDEALHTSFARRDTPAAPFGNGPPVPANSPCLSDEAGQFDFWIGDWDLEWAKGAGTNSIMRTLGGCVIRENFNDPGTGFAGGSLSVWRHREKQWRQVWMDNQGSYLSFVGGWDGEQMVLTLDNPEDTPKPDRITRMRWHDIEDNHLTWTYEGSDDDGATWTMLREIEYTRKR